jgi:hypothetical protein
VLRLRFKKKNDGTAVITAVRADGSSTHHSIGKADAYGPIHDFSHYVVESYFGFPRGFYGLLAEGWNIDDFETGARGAIPADAMLPERLAGAISYNVAGSQRFTADDINLTVGQDAVSEEQLGELERGLADLCARWRALPPGETLELEIVPGVICSHSCHSETPRA